MILPFYELPPTAGWTAQRLITTPVSCRDICDRHIHSRVCLPVTPTHSSARPAQENYGRRAEKIPLTLCGHTCTHCAVNAASCCCKSHQHRMFFFFPPRVAMKKPTRAVLVLFPLCHANFLGCLIAPQRQLKVRFFRKGSAQVSRSYTRDSHTWLDEVRVPFHFFKMWMDEVYVPLNVCFSSLRMDDCRITLFFHHYCADYHKKNYL